MTYEKPKSLNERLARGRPTSWGVHWDGEHQYAPRLGGDYVRVPFGPKCYKSIDEADAVAWAIKAAAQEIVSSEWNSPHVTPGKESA